MFHNARAADVDMRAAARLIGEDYTQFIKHGLLVLIAACKTRQIVGIDHGNAAFTGGHRLDIGSVIALRWPRKIGDHTARPAFCGFCPIIGNNAGQQGDIVNIGGTADANRPFERGICQIGIIIKPRWIALILIVDDDPRPCRKTEP